GQLVWSAMSRDRRSTQTTIEGGVEQRCPHAVSSEGIAQRSWDSAYSAVDPKASKIVGHGTGAVRGEVATHQGSHRWAQVAVTEAARQMAEVAQCSEQRLYAWIAKAQGRHALAGRRQGRQLETLEE